MQAGIKDFWDNTLRRNLMLLEQYKVSELREWERVRYLAFTNYQSMVDYGSQPWKNAYKKPSDLFELESDADDKKEYVRDEERARAAIEAARKRKQINK